MSSFAGKFLVARHVLSDPHFNRSVVLLLQHGPEGAFGLVVNRPAKIEGLPFPVFAGGPCSSQGLLLLHGYKEWADVEDGIVEGQIAPGILLGDASCLQRLDDLPESQPCRFRMFAGYAGWGPGQLENELGAGAWALTAATGKLLFETPAKELWDRLVPPALPQFSLN
jgi:putative transcriptional regulator